MLISFFPHHLSLCSQFWSTYAFIMLLCSFASPHPILPKSCLSNSVVLIEFCDALWRVKRACRSTTEGVPAAITQQNNSDSNPTRPFQILQQLSVGGGCVIVSYRNCSVYITLLMTQSCCCGHLSKKTAAFLLSGLTHRSWFDQKTRKLTKNLITDINILVRIVAAQVVGLACPWGPIFKREWQTH